MTEEIVERNFRASKYILKKEREKEVRELRKIKRDTVIIFIVGIIILMYLFK